MLLVSVVCCVLFVDAYGCVLLSVIVVVVVVGVVVVVVVVGGGGGGVVVDIYMGEGEFSTI